MKKLFTYFAISCMALIPLTVGTASRSQDTRIEALQNSVDAAAVIFLLENMNVRDAMIRLQALSNLLAAVNGCGMPHMPSEFQQQVCSDLESKIRVQRATLVERESAMDQALITYTRANEKYLEALGLNAAAELILTPSSPAAATQNEPPDASTQSGIIARLIRVQPCVYRSGGNPAKQSNYNCAVEYSLTNGTDRAIYFTSGMTEANHPWNGEKNRERFGYGQTLQPGATLNLHGECVVPHAGSVGSWMAWGTGQHRGIDPPAPDDQFSWRLEAECIV